MAADHPFNNKLEKLTFDTLDSRLKQLSPRIEIEKFVALKNNVSSLKAYKSTLDGISFRTDKAKELEAAFFNAKDKTGERAFASMKEDPDHWALKISFGETVGTGWREIWRPRRNKYAKLQDSGIKLNSDIKMRFGTAGVPFDFSALHCSVGEGKGKLKGIWTCRIHIDEAGFMLDLPSGFSLTPDVYQHTMDELLLKTKFREWAVGAVSDKDLAYVLAGVFRRVSLKFPNSFNGYAGLEKTINGFGQPTSGRGAVAGLFLGAASILKPVGVSVEAYRNKNLLVQVNYMKVNGQTTLTLTLGNNNF